MRLYRAPRRRASVAIVCARAACLLAGLASMWLPHICRAEVPVAEVIHYRIATAANKYDDTWLLAVALRSRADCRGRAWRLEASAGVIHAPDNTRPAVSVGPVWCYMPRDHNLYVEAGISPTLIAGSEVDGRDLGGDFHFTSSLALGTRFGLRRSWALALRFQHLSNGGLNRPNPGLNLLGLDLSYRFAQR